MEKTANTKEQQDVRRALGGAIGALVCLLFSLIFAVTSFAWFSSNKRVDQTGLQLGADPTANLVIADDEDDLADAGYMTFTVSFDDELTRYAPATHDSAAKYEETGLKYFSASAKIDFITGLSKEEESDADFSLAVNGSTKFYVEHTVYIASAGKQMENVTLSGAVASVKEDDVEVESGSFLATSVDFYLVGDGGELTYLGTSNAATKGAVEIFVGTIPHNTEGCVAVLMRSYFDGALKKDPTHAYINSASVNAGSVSLDVAFTAVDN